MWNCHPPAMLLYCGDLKRMRITSPGLRNLLKNISPELAHKLDVLRSHCDDVGRDYADIEKTAMIGVQPDSTPASVASTVSSLADLGFTATYVYAVGIDEPSRVVELIAGAAEEIG